MQVPAPNSVIASEAEYGICKRRIAELRESKLGSIEDAECRSLEAAAQVWDNRTVLPDEDPQVPFPFRRPG